MSVNVLLIVTGDPRVSARPAEAVRMAAGIAVWKKVAVTIYLRGAAALLLSDSLDNEECRKYWPLLAESGRPIYAQKNSETMREIEPAISPYRLISDEQLADLTAQQKYVMRF